MNVGNCLLGGNLRFGGIVILDGGVNLLAVFYAVPVMLLGGLLHLVEKTLHFFALNAALP